MQNFVFTLLKLTLNFIYVMARLSINIITRSLTLTLQTYSHNYHFQPILITKNILTIEILNYYQNRELQPKLKLNYVVHLLLNISSLISSTTAEMKFLFIVYAKRENLNLEKHKFSTKSSSSTS